MRRLIILFLAAVSVLGFAHAKEWSQIIDGIEWSGDVYEWDETLARVGSWDGEQNWPAIPIDTVGAIKVPSHADGRKIIEINDNAFLKCSKITAVTIPSTIATIGREAFMFSGIETITIPPTVTYVLHNAFERCSSLKDVTISADYQDYEEVYYNNAAFRECTALTNVTFLSGVTKIHTMQFAGCTNIRRFYFYGNAPDVMSDAFGGVPTSCIVSVPWGSKGWDDDGDGKWEGMILEYRDAPPKIVFSLDEYGTVVGGGKLVQYVTAGDRAELPLVEANVGYRFLGWFTEKTGGVKVLEDPVVVGPATYYAQYEKLKIVNFEIGSHGTFEEEELKNQYVSKGSCAVLPGVIPNFGYDFQGWFTAAEGGERVTEQTVVMDDVTYYAHWRKIDLGVNFVLGGTWTIGSTATGTGLTFAGVDETSTSGMSVQLRTDDNCSTWIETTVEGEMWVSFDWKTSCEKYGDLELDRIEFSIDGQRLAWLDGESGWTNMTFAVRGEGTHAIRFTYVKDESEYMGEDCAWVANVVMTPKTAVASPVIHLAATYETETTPCVITTDTVGAAIRYRFDYYGDESEWFDYTGPFEISGTIKVVAYATKQDYYDSESVSASCERTKPWTLAECVNAPHLDLVTGGDGDWCRTTNTTHDGVAAIRSGEIGDGEQSWVKVQMLGPGTISFWWKADSEYYKKTLLDFATFKVDGVEISKIGGASDWTQVTHDVSGDGLHTYLWTYAKNAQTAMGEDCAWLDELVWTPDTTGGVVIPSTISGGKDFAIDTGWKDEELDAKFGSGTREKFEKRYGEDVTAAFLKQSGKHDASGVGRYVWQDYVMGTDPTDKSSEFESSVEIVDGVPVITWEPDLGVNRIYKIWGRESLGVGDWQCPTNALHRFFKVSVEMK